MIHWMRLTASAVLLWVLSWACLAAEATAPPADIPRDVLTGIDAMRRLPADGMHVVESHGRLFLVSMNGHYVVTGGRLIDLWNQIEVHAVKDLDATTRLPLARMGINARILGGVTTGLTDSKQTVTVFMDPASAESRKVLGPVHELATKYKVDVVFLPAQPARAGVTRALICDARAAKSFLEESRVPPPLPDAQTCGQSELARVRATAQILGISVLPFTVAPDGSTLVGTPAHFVDFVAAHQEAP